MKKLILLFTLLSVSLYGQAVFDEGVQITGGQPTVTTTTYITTAESGGIQGKILATDLPISSAVQDSLDSIREDVSGFVTLGTSQTITGQKTINVEDEAGLVVNQTLGNIGFIVNDVVGADDSVIVNKNFGSGSGYSAFMGTSSTGAALKLSSDTGATGNSITVQRSNVDTYTVTPDGFTTIIPNINPVTGDADFNILNLSGIINQTGDANGNVTGILIDPTITSCPNGFTAIDVRDGVSRFNNNDWYAATFSSDNDEFTVNVENSNIDGSAINAIANNTAGTFQANRAINLYAYNTGIELYSEDVGMNITSVNTAIDAGNNSSSPTIYVNNDGVGNAGEFYSNGTSGVFYGIVTGINAQSDDTAGQFLGAELGISAESSNGSAGRFILGTSNFSNVVEFISVDNGTLATIDYLGNMMASTFFTPTGTGDQFLKADGSVDDSDFLITAMAPFKGTYSTTGTATTTFTVPIGRTMGDTSYVALPVATNALSSVAFSVRNKTTTTFDIVVLAGLTGTVSYDFVVTP